MYIGRKFECEGGKDKYVNGSAHLEVKDKNGKEKDDDVRPGPLRGRMCCTWPLHGKEMDLNIP